MKASRHMGGKVTRKAGGALVDEGRESKEEEKMEEGHKRGGRAKRASGGAMQAEGGMAAKRHDRPGRKRGGGVGSDKRPLTSAAAAKDADGHSGGADEVAPE